MTDWKFPILMSNMFVAVHGNVYVSLFLCGMWAIIGMAVYIREGNFSK